MTKIYAHSKDNEPCKNWQTLDSHLQNVATRAGQFASSFSSSNWTKNAGFLHDLGKATDGFQKYLRESNNIDDPDYDSVNEGRGNHSTAGAFYAQEQWGPCIGRILAYLIAGHHAGLPDWHHSDSGNAALSQRLSGIQQGDKTKWDPYLRTLEPKLSTTLSPPKFISRKNLHFWIRMLFSCLVDADYLDTETFVQGDTRRGNFQTIETLSKAFFHFLDQKQTHALDTPINKLRSEIRQACENAATKDCGLFSLTVPTGGGKTLSSMAFALKHALKHGKERIIYVIPYTSIIEQTAQQFAEIFGEENVIEHHSNLDPEKETQRTRMVCENWDAPIIVTTNVQFFESFFAARPSTCRKLHHVANSVVILDEAQLIPPEWLNPCVHIIDELTRSYKTTLVLCTATQPALPGLNPIEMIPEELNLYKRLKRVDYSLPENLQSRQSWEEITVELQKHKQVLCVVNSRRDCYDLHSLMPEGTIYLSGTLCGEHRSRVIANVKDKLKNRQPIRVISTQLVEAGVDIDFPVVFRAWTGIDSIVQSAGRCNREGHLDKGGEVHVFMPPKTSPRGLLRKAEDTTTELHASQVTDFQSPSLYKTYFNLFYGRLNEDGSEWFQNRFVRNISNSEVNIHFRTAAKEFTLIDDQAQKSVIVKFAAGETWIEKLRKEGPTRETLRKLQRYTVSVPASLASRMLADGLLEEIKFQGQKTGVLVNWMLEYDQTYGLNLWKSHSEPNAYVC